MIWEIDSAEGLASAYQITEVTAGGSPVFETGGNIMVGVIILPNVELLELTPASSKPSADVTEDKDKASRSLLGRRMSENPIFRRLVESGISELEQGYYQPVSK